MKLFLSSKKVFSPLCQGVLAFLCLAVAVSACSTGRSSLIADRGVTGYVLHPAGPDIRSAPSVRYSGGASVEIITDVIFSSLVYQEIEGNHVARLTIDIGLRNDGSLVTSLQDRIEITNNDALSRESHDVHTIRRAVPAAPGSYTVTVTVTDEFSAVSRTVETNAEVVETGAEVSGPFVVMERRQLLNGETEYVPHVAYDVPGRIDSLRFSIEVLGTSEHGMELVTRLVRFRTDTTVAWPMAASEQRSGSLQTMGIDYRRSSLISEGTHTLGMMTGAHSTTVTCPSPAHGNYRFEVELRRGQETVSSGARDFSVKSENYPNVMSPRELAAPLVYIMSSSDHRRLMAIDSEDSLKRAIDRFWMNSIEDPSLASRTIQAYYTRVEEANKLFSGYKEGWMTDPGMVYILAGRPVFTTSTHNRTEWRYVFSSFEVEPHFVFRRYRTRSRFFPFDTFVLIRRRAYDPLEYQLIQDWLSGQVHP